MRQVDIGVLHLPVVDLLAHRRVRLVGQAHLDAMHLGQRAVELGRGRGAGPQADLEILAVRVQQLDALRQRLRHRLRVAGPREAAGADIRAGRNQGGCRLSGHDLAAKARMKHTVGQGHERKTFDKAVDAARAAPQQGFILA
jgi:hypothetical protein